jgi:asparagine synthase (glutamine-hydrolysing)
LCGITGFADWFDNQSIENFSAIITSMTDSIYHRGPDDSGFWIQPEARLALGSRRLAIVDLSPTGHQPMSSRDGRYTIAYNGEVYNYLTLRAQLESTGHNFIGTSDTEVMLQAISEWGIEEAVNKFNGMFAFALWDDHKKTLSLVRDRLGIKPLYYGWSGGVFMFGSELKTLRKHPSFQGTINRNGIPLYLRYLYIPAPQSIYKNIFKLMPGTMLHLKMGESEFSINPYWSAKQTVLEGQSNLFTGHAHEAVDELERILLESVRDRMIADVPLGAFLSGGVDSSTIVALMQAQSNHPIRTFTIGFEEQAFNEADFARNIAKRIGTDHTELTATYNQALALIPQLPVYYDEPFADVSQIPTMLVSQLTRRHVTVSLSGDGGDELFGGYNRYTWAPRLWNRMRRIPGSVRRGASTFLTNLPPGHFENSMKVLQKLLPPSSRQTLYADKFKKFAEVLPVSSRNETYWNLISTWKNPELVTRITHELATLANDTENWPRLDDFTNLMMYLDLVTYLPDDILTKVDRASMAASLEARVPYLDDHRVVEFAWRLPKSMKIRDNCSKWILRQVLSRYLPLELFDRPKAGFAVPLESWLRDPLKDWAEGLLSENRLRREGFFNPEPIRQKWQEHLSGSRNWQYELWAILMFEAWLEQQGEIN